MVRGGGIAIDNNIVSGMANNGNLIYKKDKTPKIVTFQDGTDKEISAMLDAHYKGIININDYWKVGDTRLIHLSAMEESEGGEAHAAQDMTIVIIGIEHDDMKEQIGIRNKAAITLQCREILADNGKHDSENGQNYGGNGQYADNPRRTWLNNIFVGALPSTIQPLVKTVIKKNLANHTNSTAGLNTEDKAFLTSYPEMFGSARYNYYKGNVTLEGNQYAYYDTNQKRAKQANNNGVGSGTYCNYWLRSPSSSNNIYWIMMNTGGTASSDNSTFRTGGIVPAFCL